MRTRKYIYIETPYFMPNETILAALKAAVLAGVDVRVMVPVSTDAFFVQWAQQSYLADLADIGATVLLYEGGFLHSKIVVVDDSLASCGSTNIDFRSFENNFEANVFFYDVPTACRFKEIFLEDERQCVSFNLSESRSRHFLVKLWESFTRLMSPLM